MRFEELRREGVSGSEEEDRVDDGETTDRLRVVPARTMP